MSTLSQKLLDINKEALQIIKAALDTAGGTIQLSGTEDDVVLYFDTMYTESQEFYLTAIVANPDNTCTITCKEVEGDDIETHDLLGLDYEQLCAIADHLTPDEPKQFINPTLAAELAAGAFKYSALGYDIEVNPDKYRPYWNLFIYGTSISELEGSEEGVLAEYMYNSEDEAQADIDLLGELTNCQFDKI